MLACSTLTDYVFPTRRAAFVHMEKIWRAQHGVGLRLEDEAPAKSGPCAYDGSHWRVKVNGGAYYVGAITSCPCHDSGLDKTLFRVIWTR